MCTFRIITCGSMCPFPLSAKEVCVLAEKAVLALRSELDV